MKSQSDILSPFVYKMHQRVSRETRRVPRESQERPKSPKRVQQETCLSMGTGSALQIKTFPEIVQSWQRHGTIKDSIIDSTMQGFHQRLHKGPHMGFQQDSTRDSTKIPPGIPPRIPPGMQALRKSGTNAAIACSKQPRLCKTDPRTCGQKVKYVPNRIPKSTSGTSHKDKNPIKNQSTTAPKPCIK